MLWMIMFSLSHLSIKTHSHKKKLVRNEFSHMENRIEKMMDSLVPKDYTRIKQLLLELVEDGLKQIEIEKTQNGMPVIHSRQRKALTSSPK